LPGPLRDRSSQRQTASIPISDIGRLRPIPGSTFALPDSAQPGDILFNKDGTLMAATRVGTSQIDTFAVGSDHLLTPAPNSPITDSVAGPFGSEFSPAIPGRLYVSNAHGGPGNGSVWAFSVSNDGTLKAIGGAPVPDEQTAPCWVEISHDGRYLFAVNTAVSTISSYAIGANGGLTLLGSTTMNDANGLRPVDARLSPDGSTLWVADSSGFVSGFTVSGGSLTELPSSPTALPSGSSPRGIVVS
jgi:DNA-binding beta-propeller fold protein YncE